MFQRLRVPRLSRRWRVLAVIALLVAAYQFHRFSESRFNGLPNDSSTCGGYVLILKD